MTSSGSLLQNESLSANVFAIGASLERDYSDKGVEAPEAPDIMEAGDGSLSGKSKVSRVASGDMILICSSVAKITRGELASVSRSSDLDSDAASEAMSLSVGITSAGIAEGMSGGVFGRKGI